MEGDNWFVQSSANQFYLAGKTLVCWNILWQFAIEIPLFTDFSVFGFSNKSLVIVGFERFRKFENV